MKLVNSVPLNISTGLLTFPVVILDEKVNFGVPETPFFVVIIITPFDALDP
ncbi:hypothetical protein D3C80_2052960 [compost metagenome]